MEVRVEGERKFIQVGKGGAQEQVLDSTISGAIVRRYSQQRHHPLDCTISTAGTLGTLSPCPSHEPSNPDHEAVLIPHLKVHHGRHVAWGPNPS